MCRALGGKLRLLSYTITELGTQARQQRKIRQVIEKNKSQSSLTELTGTSLASPGLATVFFNILHFANVNI